VYGDMRDLDRQDAAVERGAVSIWGPCRRENAITTPITRSASTPQCRPHEARSDPNSREPLACASDRYTFS